MMVLITIPIGSAMDICEGTANTEDIPCMVVSTWAYDNCNTTQAAIFNSTPALIETKNFTDYGASGRCNFTWNYSTVDSYVWNVTNGDTGRIIVEVNDTMQLAIALVLSGFATLFILIGVYLFFKRYKASAEND